MSVTKKLDHFILNCVDVAIEKTEQVAVVEKQYQTDKVEQKTAGIGNVEAVNLVELTVVSSSRVGVLVWGRGF